MRITLRLLSFIWMLAWLAACAPSATAAPSASAPAGVVLPTPHSAKIGAPSASPPPTTGPNAPGVQVNVTLADHGISSSLTTFKVGVPYNFVIKNTGTRAICFDIAEPVSVTGSFPASRSMALVSLPESRLAVGAVVTQAYTFPPSAAGRPLELSCLQRREYDDKVRLTITVTQ